MELEERSIDRSHDLRAMKLWPVAPMLICCVPFALPSTNRILEPSDSILTPTQRVPVILRNTMLSSVAGLSGWLLKRVKVVIDATEGRAGEGYILEDLVKGYLAARLFFDLRYHKKFD